MPKPKGYAKYVRVLNVRLDEYTDGWINHLCSQLGIDRTEVIRRVLEERASCDPSYPRPEKKGVA